MEENVDSKNKHGNREMKERGVFVGKKTWITRINTLAGWRRKGE